MKYNRIHYLVTLALLTMVFFCNSCEKDEDENGDDTPQQESYRIEEEVKSEDSQNVSKETYEYSGEKISKVMIYDYNGKDLWEEDQKDEYSYPDAATVVITNFEMVSGEWEENDKEEIRFANGVWSEHITYNHDGVEWNPSTKTAYTYQGSQLVGMIDYDYVGGMEIAVYKIDFTWNGDKVQDATSYNYQENDWKKVTKDTIYYQDGTTIEKIETWSFDAQEVVQRVVFAYQGGKLESMTTYIVDFMGNWNQVFKNSYEYDEHGNLSKHTNFTDYLGTTKTFVSRYSYDKGSGNFRQIWGQNSGWFSWYPTPAKNLPEKEFFQNKFQY